jgi:hypothetical protein
MSKLERLAYLCLISLCMVSGGVLLRNQLSQHTLQASILNSHDLIGKKLDVPGANWNATAMSAVLFLSTECRFCEASMPFYRQLVEAHGQSPTNHIALLGLSREPDHDMEEHLAKNHVRLDRVLQLPHNFNLLRGTPTLLFVDQSGIIRRAFVGKLNEPEEQQIVALVKADDLATAFSTSKPGR